MSETTKLKVDDVNVRLICEIQEDDVVLDVSTASSKTIIIKKPDDTKLTNTATFLIDGADGLIYCDTVAGDLDIPGLYRVQAIVIIGSGTYHSEIKSFLVECNL